MKSVISFTTTARVMQQMRDARDIDLCAYLLHSKQMMRTLELAAQRGAHVRVQLEAHPYADKGGKLAQINRDTVVALHAAGVHAKLVDRSGRRANHMKAAIVDRVAFLDDRNWPAGRRNSVIYDDNAHDVSVIDNALHGNIVNGGAVVVTKGSALAQEAGVLRGSRRPVSIETESFGAGTAPYGAIKALARSGVHVRLLICKDDAKRPTMSAARAFARDGVDVRLTRASEKFAVAGKTAWIGSANATFGREDQIDWGLRIEERSLCQALQRRFNSTWRVAQPLTA